MLNKTKHEEHYDYVVLMTKKVIKHMGISKAALKLGIHRATLTKYLIDPKQMTLGFVFYLEQLYNLVVEMEQIKK